MNRNLKPIYEFTLESLSSDRKMGLMLFNLACLFLALWVGTSILGLDFLASLNWLLLACIPIIPLHEGMHALFFRIFGGKVKFGVGFKLSFGGIIFWATSPNNKFSKKKFQAIALAPQILTVLLPLLLFLPMGDIPKYLLVGALAFNLGGGCLDLYTFFLLMRYPSNVLVEDLKDGIRVYG